MSDYSSLSSLIQEAHHPQRNLITKPYFYIIRNDKTVRYPFYLRVPFSLTTDLERIDSIHQEIAGLAHCYLMRLFQLVREERLSYVADIRFRRREDIHQVRILQIDLVRFLQAGDAKSRFQ